MCASSRAQVSQHGQVADLSAHCGVDTVVQLMPNWRAERKVVQRWYQVARWDEGTHMDIGAGALVDFLEGVLM